MITSENVFDVLGYKTSDLDPRDAARIVYIMIGISLAKKSGNPMWAEAHGTQTEFRQASQKYADFVKLSLGDDYENEINKLNILLSTISFRITSDMRFARNDDVVFKGDSVIDDIYRDSEISSISFSEDIIAIARKKRHIDHLAYNAEDIIKYIYEDLDSLRGILRNALDLLTDIDDTCSINLATYGRGLIDDKLLC